MLIESTYGTNWIISNAGKCLFQTTTKEKKITPELENETRKRESETRRGIKTIRYTTYEKNESSCWIGVRE
jgi:hypothetical protein